MRYLTFLLALIHAVAVLAGDPPAAKAEPRLVDQWWYAVHTIADARSLQTCIEAYYIDHRQFPPAASVDELRKLIEPIYIRTTPMKDAWGTPFLYRVSADGQSYALASAGSDRKFDDGTCTAAYTTSSKDDLVYQPHDFVREWVIQRVK